MRQPARPMQPNILAVSSPFSQVKALSPTAAFRRRGQPIASETCLVPESFHETIKLRGNDQAAEHTGPERRKWAKPADFPVMAERPMAQAQRQARAHYDASCRYS